MKKAAALAALVERRRNDSYPGYRHLHSFDNGSWDCEYVVPWTKSACNLDARLMIIGQDWASENYLQQHDSAEERTARQRNGQDEELQTNKRLKMLLGKHFELCFCQTYATNVLVFINGQYDGQRTHEGYAVLRGDLRTATN